MFKKKNQTQESDQDKHGSVYQMVTKRILDSMMNGEIPWRKTYVHVKGQKAPYRNFVTGKPYSFLNSLLLGEPGEYGTFNQIKEHGGTIKKGAKSRMVIYWGEFIPTENKAKAKELEEAGENFDHLKVKFPKYYLVFNLNDTEGVKREEAEPMPETQRAEAPTAVARMVIDDYKTNEQVTLEEKMSYEPVYLPEIDTVKVPLKTNYHLEEDWFASVFGGFVHSTATEDRCNRETEMKKMLEGEMSVKEELIAEIGSSMILTACGLERKETHQQLAAECQKWVNAMNKDFRLIVMASNAAEKAAKYVLGEFAA